jgi:hypothetical protein
MKLPTLLSIRGPIKQMAGGRMNLPAFKLVFMILLIGELEREMDSGEI